MTCSESPFGPPVKPAPVHRSVLLSNDGCCRQSSVAGRLHLATTQQRAPAFSPQSLAPFPPRTTLDPTWCS
eukprot:11522839-Alexandrium_andersonii.AAC.1